MVNEDKSMADLVEAYENLQRAKEQAQPVVSERTPRVIRSANAGTHIPNKGRVMNQLYIVDTGTYQNNTQQIASMRDAGLALAMVRQQLLYGQDLELASPATRIRYHDKIELYEESRRLNSLARQRKHMADEKAKMDKEKAELEKANSKANEGSSDASGGDSGADA